MPIEHIRSAFTAASTECDTHCGLFDPPGVARRVFLLS
jgi:hypothetical protein